MSEIPEYILDRVFDAPREMVWRAWTDPELLSRWYGPGVGTIIHEFDLKPGGMWLNEMKWGDNSDLSKVVFQGSRVVHHTKPKLGTHAPCGSVQWSVYRGQHQSARREDWSAKVTPQRRHVGVSRLSRKHWHR